ncbi:hypothetical protein [Actinopolymorpha sp. B11F2]|uniref:hypothetical protein n=1 Tax=Actinopolymorpha sp. B11F2 TaxID=3160862 RepID=UPI0032E3A030
MNLCRKHAGTATGSAAPAVRLAAATAYLLLGASMLAACGSGGDAVDPTDAAKQSPSRSASPTPSTSPEEYRKTLTAAGAPVDAALAKVTAAKSLPTLNNRLAAAGRVAAETATTLDEVRPPNGEESAHLELLAGLQSFQVSAERAVASPARDNSCKAAVPPSSVVASLDVASLNQAVRSLKTRGYDTGIHPVAVPKVSSRRLRHGQFVRSGSRTGNGTLVIDNGGDTDAFVAFATGKSQTFSVYVRKGGTFTVHGIRYGTYTGYFATGEDFDSRAKGFTRNCGFEKFDEPFSYPSGYQSTFTITLHTVVGGDASTTELDPNQFPS